jgi:ATP-dependent Clp protease ATP-binding subunit ClpC
MSSILQRVFERFTDRSRRVLVLAQEEARELNHGFIGTEHLLLGLIGEGRGIAAKALESLGMSLAPVRQKIEEAVGPMSGMVPGDLPPFTPRAKKVLELSLREALQLGHSYIGTEHLLLGLVREGEGVGATILVGLGADLSRVRQQVIMLMSESMGQVQVRGAISEGAISSLGDDVLTTAEPRCPQCRSGLTDGVHYRTIAAAPDVDDDDREPITIDVVYCDRCGMTLNMSRTDGT